MANITYRSKTAERYWKDRLNLKESLGGRTEKEMLSHLKALYQNTMLEINKEIEAFYGRYAENNSLTLAEVKKRLNPDELKSAKYEIARYYSEIDRLARNAGGKVSAGLLRKYKNELRSQSARAYMSRLEDLKTRIKNSLVKMGLEEDGTLFKSLSKTGEKAYLKSAYELSKYRGFANAIPDGLFAEIVNERWLGANYSERVWESKLQLENELEKTFLRGAAGGHSPRKIAEEMQRNMGGAYHRCERLARTEMMHALNESTARSYRDYGVKEYQFVCGLDERTCPDCGALDGQVFRLSEKIEGVNYPVMHPSCVTGDSVVLSPDAEKIMRSEYSGNIFKVFTSNGGSFTVTPNHIMLTSRGWVRAKNIIKGDKVIRYRGWDKIGVAGNPAYNDSIPAIENLFASFRKFGFMFSRSVPASAEDLKGDVTKNAKIDIVDVNGFLRNIINFSFRKFFSDFRLVKTDKTLEGFFPRDSTMTEFLMCAALASDGVMSVDGVLNVFFSCSFAHHKLIRFLLRSNYNTRLFKSVVNNVSCDIKDFGKFVDAFSRIIQFDDVVNVECSDFSGQVYDVSSLSTLYIVNGYLSSNCRCTTIPYFEKDGIDERFDESDRVAYDENHKIYDVPAGMTYAEWLETVRK